MNELNKQTIVSDQSAAVVPGALTPPVLTIVLPTYNEADNIAVIVDLIAKALDGLPHEIIVVDDDSPDGTAMIARTISAQQPHVRCIRRVGRRGLSGACVEGMMAASAPVIVIMDADMQHDETRLPLMLAAIDRGADLVIGSRYANGRKAGGGFHDRNRARGSELATSLANVLTRRHTTDPMSGFFMLRRQVADQVAGGVSREGFKILFDIVSQYGDRLKIAEVPFEFRERQAGESKLGLLVTVQFLGLLVSRYTGGLVPVQFLLFALVGMTGVGVHMASFLMFEAAGINFIPAQTMATYIAMTSNFIFNNRVTYGHRRLKGDRFWGGLVTFYAICSVGVLANLAVGERVLAFGMLAWAAGLAGAVMSALFNFAVTRLVTWRD